MVWGNNNHNSFFINYIIERVVNLVPRKPIRSEKKICEYRKYPIIPIHGIWIIIRRCTSQIDTFIQYIILYIFNIKIKNWNIFIKNDLFNIGNSLTWIGQSDKGKAVNIYRKICQNYDFNLQNILKINLQLFATNLLNIFNSDGGTLTSWLCSKSWI